MQVVPLEQGCTTSSIRVADGVHTESVRIFKAGMQSGHHAHAYEHTTIVVRGAVEAWADGALLGVFREMESLVVKAGVKHRFTALEDDTTFICVHNVGRSGEIDYADRFTVEDFR